MAYKLSTFQLHFENGTTSPVLTSTREYGKWLETVFSPDICRTELYKAGWDRLGRPIWENHPGSKIGQWFDRQEFSNAALLSWFIHQDSRVMKRLCMDERIAEWRDAIPISVSDKKGRKLLRCYSIEQLQLYIRSNLDKTFSISGRYKTPELIYVDDAEVDEIIVPQVKKRLQRLF